MQRNVVYAARCGRYLKIGYTTNLAQRIRSLNSKTRGCQHPHNLAVGERAILVGWLDGNLWVERAIHQALSERRAHGDWYYRDDFLDQWANSLPHSSAPELLSAPVRF